MLLKVAGCGTRSGREQQVPCNSQRSEWPGEDSCRYLVMRRAELRTQKRHLGLRR